MRRRTLFRGATLGLGGVFLRPFLSQLKAQATAHKRPARVVFFVQGNGMYPGQIQPAGIDRPSEPDVLEERSLTGARFARSVEPLEPFADRMCLLHGLSGRVALGNHGTGMGGLGCFPSQKNVFMETIDAALAKALPGLFRHVGLGVESSAKETILYNVSAWEKGLALPTQCNPLLAHRSLFALAGGPDVRKKFEADERLLDFLAEDVKRVQVRLQGSEKAKLEHYLNAFESMNDRRSALVRLADRIAMAAPEADERFGGDSYAFQRMEAQFEIAAGALIGGLTNVVTVSSGAGRDQTGVDFDGYELGLRAGPVPAHEVGHNQMVQGTDPVELHIRTRQRHCEKLATFIRKLDSIPEAEGTMMDNTVVVYLSDAAEQHHPQAREWPMIVIGDLGGRLRTKNRYLRFPWYGKPGHRTVAAFYMALLHAVGDRRDRFGVTDPALADLDQSGPLTEVLA